MFGMKLAKVGSNFWKRKVYPNDEMDFPTTKCPYGFSDHLLHLFFYLYFIISFPNDSQYLPTSVVISRYRIPCFTKISAGIL